MVELVALFLLPGIVAFAAAMDLFTLTIPNKVSVIMALAFLPVAGLAGIGWWAIADHLFTGLVVLGLGIGLFALGWFGGGDAKLVAATALWIGSSDLLAYFIYVALAGGVLAIVLGLARQVPLPRQLLGEEWAVRLHRPGGGIPYGIALAIGGLLVFPHTPLFAALAH